MRALLLIPSRIILFGNLDPLSQGRVGEMGLASRRVRSIPEACDGQREFVSQRNHITAAKDVKSKNLLDHLPSPSA